MLCRRGELGLALTTILIGLTPISNASAAGEGTQYAYASVGDTTRAPIGWVEFCADNAAECSDRAVEARDVVLSFGAWKDLVRVNRWVNETIKPVTDLEHWGVVEKWSLPTDGY